MHENALAESNKAPKYPSEAHDKLARKLWAMVRGVEDARNRSGRYTEWKHAENAMWQFHSIADISGLEKDDRAIVTQLYEDMLHLPVVAGMIQTYLSVIWGMYNANRPIFDVSAREPSDHLPAKIMQLKLDYEVDRKKLLLHKLRQCYDAAVYGFGVISLDYAREVKKKTFWRAEHATNPDTGEVSYQSVREKGDYVAYEGNSFTNVSPYNFGSDWRYPAWDIQKGAFVFHRHTEHLDNILANKWYRNLDELRKRSDSAGGWEYQRHFNNRQGQDRDLQLTPSETRISTEERTAKYIEKFTFQIKIVPKEHFPEEGGDMLETYQVIMTDSGIILDARPLDNDHGEFTYASCAVMPFEDVTYPASVVEMLRPMQDEINWLVNSNRISVRRSINGWWLYNPLYLDEAELKPARFAKYIKTKPNVPQGLPFDQILKQIEFGDPTQRNLQGLGMFLESMKQATGITDMVQGIPVSGRRTATEAGSLTQYAINRIQFYAGIMAIQADADLARQMVANNQQYMENISWMRLGGETYEEIALELQNMGKDLSQQYLRIAPWEIAGNFDFPTYNPTSPQDASPAKVEGMVRLYEGLLRAMPALMQSGYAVDFGELSKELGRTMGFKNMSSLIRSVQQAPMPQVMGMEGAPV